MYSRKVPSLNEKWIARFSLSRVLFWLCLLLPSYFFGWVYSVAFVSVCSLYANVASDFAAYRADKNTDILKRLSSIEAKVDQLLEGRS